MAKQKQVRAKLTKREIDLLAREIERVGAQRVARRFERTVRQP